VAPLVGLLVSASSSDARNHQDDCKFGESSKRSCGVSSRSRRVLTKVGVTNKEYGFKRIDTLLRKWNAKAIKRGV